MNMVLNISSLCRLCLRQEKNEELVPLFIEEKADENILSLPKKVMALTSIKKMFSGDGFPGQVCQQCVHKVTTSYDFKLLCEQSDAKLRGYISNHTNGLASRLSEDLRVKQENTLEDRTSINVPRESDMNMHHISKSWNISERYTQHVEDVKQNKDTSIHLSSSGKNGLYTDKSGCCNTQPSVPKTETVEMVEPLVGENESEDDSNNSIFSGDVGLLDDCADSGLKPLFYVDVKDSTTKAMRRSSSERHKTKHIKRLNMPAKYNCSFCKKPFVNKAHLTQHLMTHTGERPYVCHVCGVAFARYSNLTRHSLRHAREESRDLKRGRHRNDISAFECAICLKIFKRKPYLVEHLMSHSGEKPYKCEVCGVGFRRHSNLVRHIKSHSESDYLTGQLLRRGRRRGKDNGIRYNCDVCSKTFKVSSHLKTHMMTHTGEKPFMCDVCGQFFARRTNMVRHTRLHTEGSYQPGEIPKRGRRRNNLSFECHICSKPFQHMSRWREHLMSHTGEKPHMCDVCGKFFARRTNLIRHSKVHMGVITSA